MSERESDHTAASRRQRAYKALLRDKRPDLFDEMGRLRQEGRAEGQQIDAVMRFRRVTAKARANAERRRRWVNYALQILTLIALAFLIAEVHQLRSELGSGSDGFERGRPARVRSYRSSER